MNNRLILYNSKGKLIGYSFLFGSMGGGTFFAGIHDNLALLIISFMCWFSFVIALIKIINNNPRVIIDEKGITDFRGKYGLIPWEDIEAIWCTRYDPDRYLCLSFKRPENYVQAISATQKTDRYYWGDFRFHVGSLNTDFEDVWYHIHRLKSSGKISVMIR